MPANKDFKRLVRSRMLKTGESYTSARARLLSRAKPGRSPSTPPASSLPPASEFATRAGYSDATIKGKTGCNWKSWVHALDHVKAGDWPHGAIAQYVHEKYKVPGWWAQAVTVGYERILGRREIGQRLDGTYEATRSRTFDVPVGRLFRACSEKRNRARWLDEAIVIRTQTKDRSMRVTWHDGTSLQLWFTAKGPKKCTLSLAHARLPDQATAARLKGYWSERLDALARVLAPRRG